MAQVVKTFILDSKLNEQLSSLCERLGVSINSVLNQLVKNAVTSDRFTEGLLKDSDHIDTPYTKLNDLFWNMRADIVNEPEMSYEEINKEIAASRKQQKCSISSSI